MAFNPNRNQEFRIEALLDKAWENGITGQQGIDKIKASPSDFEIFRFFFLYPRTQENNSGWAGYFETKRKISFEYRFCAS